MIRLAQKKRVVPNRKPMSKQEWWISKKVSVAVQLAPSSSLQLRKVIRLAVVFSTVQSRQHHPLQELVLLDRPRQLQRITALHRMLTKSYHEPRANWPSRRWRLLPNSFCYFSVVWPVERVLRKDPNLTCQIEKGRNYCSCSLRLLYPSSLVWKLYNSPQLASSWIDRQTRHRRNRQKIIHWWSRWCNNILTCYFRWSSSGWASRHLPLRGSSEAYISAAKQTPFHPCCIDRAYVPHHGVPKQTEEKSFKDLPPSLPLVTFSVEKAKVWGHV